MENIKDQSNVDDLGGVTISVDYATSAEMRISLAMNNIQKYSAMQSVDDEYAAEYDAWVSYFRIIKQLYDSKDLVKLFETPMP